MCNRVASTMTLIMWQLCYVPTMPFHESLGFWVYEGIYLGMYVMPAVFCPGPKLSSLLLSFPAKYVYF